MNIKISIIEDKSDMDILKWKSSKYQDLIIKYKEYDDDTINFLKRHFDNSENLYLMAKIWDNFAWFCSIDSEWWEDNYFFIREIFIEPKFQKHGLWKDLMKVCIDHAKTKRSVWVITQTAFENIPMQKLCEKLWFQKWDNPLWKEGITYKLIFNKNKIDE